MCVVWLSVSRGVRKEDDRHRAELLHQTQQGGRMGLSKGYGGRSLGIVELVGLKWSIGQIHNKVSDPSFSLHFQ